MKIAVTYKDGEIFEHFGHCETFAIYDYPESSLENVSKKLVDCGDRHGHTAMAELMQQEGVDAVICGNMGAEARAILLSMGIVPVPGYCGNADIAADLLILGQLPAGDGGQCSGGCGGCSGCGGHDEGDEGCGCGGCCH